MKVCVLGNSQVAALRMAIDKGSCRFPHKLDFYSTCHPCIRNGRIHPLFMGRTIYTTVEEAAEKGLDFSAYDVLILSAAGLLAYRNENRHLMFEIRLPGWPAMPGGNTLIPAIISSGLFTATATEMLRTIWAIKICSQIAKDFIGRIIVQPWPLPSESILNDASWKIRLLYGEKAAEVSAYFYNAQYQAIIDLLSKIRKDIVVLGYPDKNWLDYGFTPAVYETRDPWHMNDKYGALVMGQVIDALS